ncbi:MAG: hypothetical protein RL260_1915 [Pseudomonadota bacterium]|jgi:hypothetical protein
MTELQRIACDTLAAAVRLCDAAGLALVPGPTHVTVYVPQRYRPSCYSSAKVLDLPQIAPKLLGRSAPRRRAA